MTMTAKLRKFEIPMGEVRLFPSEPQASRMLAAHTKLQSARVAVADAQYAHIREHGEHLVLSDIWTHKPRVRIEEAVSISSGIIDVFTVRSWLHAGLKDGRGEPVDEEKLNKMYYPSISWEYGTAYLHISCIGKIPMEGFPFNGVNPKEMKAYLTFPDTPTGEWRVTFYTDEETAELCELPVERAEPTEAEPTEAEPTEPTERPFAVRILMDAAEEVLSRDDLTECQTASLEMLVEAFCFVHLS